MFGQAAYKFNDQWKVSLGVREDHENRELIGLNTAFLGVAPSLAGGPQNRDLVSNLPSAKFELDYKPLADTLLYASVSRGVKSGGFTAHNTVNAASADAFEPEKLTAYEVGAKSDITRSLRLNAAAYYYRYRDQQILGKVFDEVSGSYVGRFTNANSRISGAEVEVDWLPAQGLSISQYAGFVEGYYTSSLFDGAVIPGGDPRGHDFNGRPESIPKWSYGGELSYAIPVGGYKITPEFNYSMHDTYSQFFLLGSNDFTIPRYWLSNANVSFAPTDGKWSVSLWGRNIFDRRYDITRNFFLPTSEVALAGEPATFGIRFNIKY